MKLVGAHNAEGITEARAKRLQLSYEIKHHTEAVFVYFTFKMFGDDMKALEHELNTRDDVLRFMVIASPAPAERTATSAMPPREERRPRSNSYTQLRPRHRKRQSLWRLPSHSATKHLRRRSKRFCSNR